MRIEKVQLKFDSLLNLWSFKEKVDLYEFEIISREYLLICQLSQQDIEVALQHYGAELLTPQHA